MKIAVFFKDGKLTGGLMTVTAGTKPVIDAWCAHPGCTVTYTTIEVIK